ncbi:PepSY domain-containing protein [Desulforamulus ruminis]|uniref:PepSY domain-containing protein n=1 Tax=Desulforamulus ruminis TaxID=1564 RepID=UPI002FD9F382
MFRRKKVRINRQLHLWIGLITSVLILIEAVTGLLMTEPWLMGVNKPSIEHRNQAGQLNPEDSSKIGEPGEGQHFSQGGQGNNNLMHVVKNLHAGRIGNTDVSILLDVVAIGMIILTITGIILSERTLRAQSKQRRKKYWK